MSRLLPEEARGLGTRAAALSFLSNLLFLVVKLVVGIVAGSVAVLSDAVDSAGDLVASGAALLSVRIAARPADAEHPYGHGKVESLGTIVEAVVISVGGAVITVLAVRRFITGEEVSKPALGVYALAAAAATNFLLSRYVRFAARKTDSLVLMADARHLETNVVQALGVVAALALVWSTGLQFFDPLVGLGLAVFLFWTAWQLLRGAAHQIMDVRLPDAEVEAIRTVILRYPEVRGFHRLRSRRSGPQRFIEIHLVVPPESTLEVVHHLCDRIEHDIQERLPHSVVTIHPEPDDGRFLGPLDPRAEHARAGEEGHASGGASPLP